MAFNRSHFIYHSNNYGYHHSKLKCFVRLIAPGFLLNMTVVVLCTVFCFFTAFLNTHSAWGSPNTDDNSLETISIQLNMWSRGYYFAGYYAAVEKGFYASEGLNVQLKERDFEKYNVESVLDGEAEYGISDSGLLLYRMEGEPVVLLGQIFQHSPLIFITKRESGIVSPYEMIGKRVMMELRVKYEAPLYAAIKEILGGISKVNAIQHNFNYNEFLSGKVDAIATFITDQPYLMKKWGVDVNIINPQSYGMDFYGDNLFTTEKEIAGHPGRAERVLRATLKGWQYALSHQEEMIDFIQRKYVTSTDRALLEYEAKMIDIMILPELIPLGEVNPARYNWAAETFYRLGMAKTATVPEGFIRAKKSEPTLSMKQEERVWLSEHPQIRVGIMDAWPPLNFVDKQGRLQGIGVEYIKVINKRLGGVLVLEAAPFAENYDRVKNQQLDALMDITPQPEREPYFNFTNPYLIVPHVIVGRKDGMYFDSENDLAGKKVAIESGFFNIKNIQQNYPEIIVVEYETTRGALDAVSRSEVDAYIGNRAVIIHLIEKDLLTNLKVMGQSSKAPVVLTIGIRKDWPEFLSILNQALASITQEEYRTIRRKWTSLEQESTDITPKLTLSQDEKEWLSRRRQMRLGVDPYHPPYDFIDTTNMHNGVASDYVTLLNQQLDIDMQLEASENWNDVMEKIRKGEIDVLPCIVKTPTRSDYLLFTQPYLRVPLVILTREDAPFVKGISDFPDLKVALIEGYASSELVSRDYPQKKFLFVNDLEEALLTVSKGKADAFVGDLETIRYATKKLGLLNLRVAATTPYNLDFSFAVRKDWPELIVILDKALQSIPESEKKRFLDRWTQVEVEHEVDWVMVWWVALISLIILGCIVYWNRRLAREIVGRKRIEEALRDSENKYRELVENANSIILRMDIEGNITFFNEFAEKFFGYSKKEIIGRNVINTIVPETDSMMRDLKSMIQNLILYPEKYKTNENENMRCNGDRVWIAWTNKPLYNKEKNSTEILCVGNDITEIKKRDEKLHHYEFITNAVRVMMSLVRQDYVYEAVNNEYCTSVCKNREDIIGHSASDVWGRDAFEQYIQPCFERCFQGEELHYEVWLNLTKLGRRFCSIKYYPYRNVNGKITHAVVVTEDVTAQKQAEEELQKAMEVADAANQAKSIFLANMSHEIRTPMNAILGYSQLLHREPGITRQQKEFIEIVNRSGEHLMDLINDVLEMSKIESGRITLNPETFDFHSLLDDLEAMFQGRLDEKMIQLRVERVDDIPRILHADEGKIKQALINIIGNALKFTDQGQIVIRVYMERSEDENPPSQDNSYPKCKISIDVEDTGCGITPDEIEKVFNQFEQTESGKNRGVGTGLGMPISRRYARMMGGDITLTSELGEGSIFRLEFEAEIRNKSETEVHTSPTRRVERIAPDQKSLHVLVVDDRDTNRDLLARMLSNVGFTVREAEDGFKAIEIFKDWRPDMIFMDMVMPGIDGCETMKRIRSMETGVQIPILMVSASALVEDLNKAIEAGADGFIRKPFREEELYQEIERHAHVKFIYIATNENEIGDVSTEEGRLAKKEAIRQSLSGLPDELVEQMLQAINQGYINKLIDLIRQVEKIDAALSEYLMELADGFDFYALNDLFDRKRQES